MFRKSYLTLVFAAALLLAGQTVAYSQYGDPVRGRVELKKEDGSREPVAGALVEVYRTDIKSSSPSAKASKKGEFTFAGLLYGALYAFSVSAPNCAPTIYPNVKAGDENVVITLSPGDGRKWTEAEVRKAVAGGNKSNNTGAQTGAQTANTTNDKPEDSKPVELTEEQKKAQAEYEEKVAKRDKILKTNDVVANALKAGNEAYTARNFDLAVAKYDEGISADPDFVGSAPVLNSNRAAALTARAIDSYNKAVKIADATEKIAALAKVKQDFSAAGESYLRSWNLLKTPPAPDVMSKEVYESVKLGALRGARETFDKAVRTEQIEQGTIDAAKILLPEYIIVETDAAKKRSASLALGDLYRIFGDSENAIATYTKILETTPDDIDALAGAGFSLVNLGFINNDKAKLQEGANLLQKFAGLAPDSNKYKVDALGLIDTLKKEQNVMPQKVPATPRKRT